MLCRQHAMMLFLRVCEIAFGLLISVYAAFLEVLPFIWLQEVVLLIASENCWLGALIGFKEMPRGI